MLPKLSKDIIQKLYLYTSFLINVIETFHKIFNNFNKFELKWPNFFFNSIRIKSKIKKVKVYSIKVRNLYLNVLLLSVKSYISQELISDFLLLIQRYFFPSLNYR